MRLRYCASRRTEGFVLLYTLWLLMGGVVLLATVSALAVGRARGAATSVDWLRSTAAAESAGHETMFRLVGGGRLALAATPRRETLIDSVRLQVEATNSDGLVDLNAAEEAVLIKAFAAALPGDATDLVHAVRGIGPLRSYAQLGAIDGLDPAQLTCLLRYVTLSSGKAIPAAEFTPDRVRSALGLRADQGAITAVAAPGSLAGSSARIDVEVLQTDGTGRRLLIDALVTGRLDRPISVLEWHWLPGTDRRTPLATGCVVGR